MCGDAQVSSVKANYKHIKIMTLKEKCILGAVSSYETPSVKTLEVLSEGVLCGSYGDANEAGAELHESNVWNF